MYLNRAMIIGNVTRDPDVRTTASGQTVANFGVATNQVWTDASGVRQEKAEFHNIVAWAKLAEIIQRYVTKGRKIYVEGRLQTRDWQAQDGMKRTRTEIVADNMILLDRPPVGGQPNFGGASQATGEAQVAGVNSQQPAAASSAQPAVSSINTDEIKVEDIPF